MERVKNKPMKGRATKWYLFSGASSLRSYSKLSYNDYYERSKTKLEECDRDQIAKDIPRSMLIIRRYILHLTDDFPPKHTQSLVSMNLNSRLSIDPTQNQNQNQSINRDSVMDQKSWSIWSAVDRINPFRIARKAGSMVISSIWKAENPNVDEYLESSSSHSSPHSSPRNTPPPPPPSPSFEMLDSNAESFIEQEISEPNVEQNEDPIEKEIQLYKDKLERILHALCCRYPDIGYVQGHDRIVIVLLGVIENEEDVFWTACAILEQVFPIDFYSKNPKLHGFHVEMGVLEELIKIHLPQVVEAIGPIELSSIASLLAFKWFIPLWTDELPLDTLYQVWDCLLSPQTCISRNTFADSCKIVGQSKHRDRGLSLSSQTSNLSHFTRVDAVTPMATPVETPNDTKNDTRKLFFQAKMDASENIPSTKISNVNIVNAAPPFSPSKFMGQSPAVIQPSDTFLSTLPASPSSFSIASFEPFNTLETQYITTNHTHGSDGFDDRDKVIQRCKSFEDDDSIHWHVPEDQDHLLTPDGLMTPWEWNVQQSTNFYRRFIAREFCSIDQQSTDDNHIDSLDMAKANSTQCMTQSPTKNEFVQKRVAIENSGTCLHSSTQSSEFCEETIDRMEMNHRIALAIIQKTSHVISKVHDVTQVYQILLEAGRNFPKDENIIEKALAFDIPASTQDRIRRQIRKRPMLAQMEVSHLTQVTNFSAHHLRRLQQEFRLLEKRSSRDGITLVELRSIFQQVAPDWPQSHVTRLFQILDRSGRKVVQFLPLMTTVSVITQGSVEEKLKLCFDLYDPHNTGQLDLSAIFSMAGTLYDILASQNSFAKDQAPQTLTFEPYVVGPLRHPTLSGLYQMHESTETLKTREYDALSEEIEQSFKKETNKRNIRFDEQSNESLNEKRKHLTNASNDCPGSYHTSPNTLLLQEESNTSKSRNPYNRSASLPISVDWPHRKANAFVCRLLRLDTDQDGQLSYDEWRQAALTDLEFLRCFQIVSDPKPQYVESKSGSSNKTMPLHREEKAIPERRHPLSHELHVAFSENSVHESQIQVHKSSFRTQGQRSVLNRDRTESNETDLSIAELNIEKSEFCNKHASGMEEKAKDMKACQQGPLNNAEQSCTRKTSLVESSINHDIPQSVHCIGGLYIPEKGDLVQRHISELTLLPEGMSLSDQESESEDVVEEVPDCRETNCIHSQDINDSRITKQETILAWKLFTIFLSPLRWITALVVSCMIQLFRIFKSAIELPYYVLHFFFIMIPLFVVGIVLGAVTLPIKAITFTMRAPILIFRQLMSKNTGKQVNSDSITEDEHQRSK